MGIRGLNKFINQSTHKLVLPHQLHDTYLVIDGDSFVCQLYINYADVYDSFGGDYDRYGRILNDFYANLVKCRVTPIVIFDGASEFKKIDTIFRRHVEKTDIAGRIAPNSEGNERIFPVMLKQLSADIAKRLGLYTYRCEFEADNEVASVARALNCPVLTFDSDFFIYDVLYIPFNDTFDIAPKFMNPSQFCMHCTLYKPQNFFDAFPGLSKKHLPLLALLLGNDYINPDVFDDFFDSLGVSFSGQGEQLKIRTAIYWLKAESYDSAHTKIIQSRNPEERPQMIKIIDAIVQGYVYCKSSILDDLNIDYQKTELLNAPEKHHNNSNESQTAEECTMMLSGMTLHNNVKAINVPDWFLKKHLMCCYQTCIYEFAQGVLYFFNIQVEDYSNKFSHYISFPVISAINKIISQTIQGREVPITVTGRRGDELAVFKIPVYEKTIIRLSDIPTLSRNDKTDLILDVLNLQTRKTAIWKALESAPAEWHMLLISIIYWIENANLMIKDSHIYSLLLSAVIVKVVDAKIGPFRNVEKLPQDLNKNVISTSTATTFEQLQDIFDNISKGECIATMKTMIPFFFASPTILHMHSLTFERRIVHAFAQLQSCIFYIDALNTLLDEPLEKMYLSNFYNGTLIYNTYVRLNERNDVHANLKVLLKESPNVLKACERMKQIVIEDANLSTVPKKKMVVQTSRCDFLPSFAGK